MYRTVSRTVCELAFAVLVASVVGCSRERQCDVSGQVKYNGSPLDKPGGQIVFVGPNGRQVAAEIARDGTYRAAKVTAGPNRIAVYYTNPAVQGGKRFSKPKKGDPPFSPSAAAPPFLTPSKYASVQTSDLSVEVAEGTVFDIDLTGPPIR